MQNKAIVIVGGGLAGSLAAAMLGKAGIAAILFDPHTVGSTPPSTEIARS